MQKYGELWLIFRQRVPFYHECLVIAFGATPLGAPTPEGAMYIAELCQLLPARGLRWVVAVSDALDNDALNEAMVLATERRIAESFAADTHRAARFHGYLAAGTDSQRVRFHNRVQKRRNARAVR